MVVAFVALSVALAGSATALPGRNSVKKDDIRTNAVGKSEIRSGAVGRAEAAGNSVGESELIEGAVTGRQVAESTLVDVQDLGGGAVTTDELADNSVTSAKVLDATLAAADLETNSVNTDELATNAVTSDELAGDSVDATKVSNGGLDAADNKGADVVRPDFANIAPGTCHVLEIATGVDTVGETVAVTPRESFPGMLTIATSGSNLAGAFRLNVCNPTAAAVDPPATNFSFVVFDN